MRIFVGLVVLCVLFFLFDKLSHIKGYLETPDSHTHSQRERREIERREREGENTPLSNYEQRGNLEIRCKDVVSV